MKLKIQTRIMLLYLLLSAVLLAVLLPVVYSSVSASLRHSVESTLKIEAAKLAAAIETEEGTLIVSPEADVDVARGVALAAYYAGEPIYSSSAAFPDSSWGLPAQAENITVEKTLSGQKWLLVQQEFSIEESTVIIAAACSMAAVQDSLRDLQLLLVALVPLFLGLSAVGAALLARRALRPIADITRTALQIGAGDLTQRIPKLNTQDEVGELAAAFNQMLDNVEESFRRERQFSSDASHELRTPLAVIAACAEDALAAPQSEATEENLLSIQKESARMSHIISQLLTLTRGYEGRTHVEKEVLCARDMVGAVLEELTGTAQRENITLYNEVPEGITLYADQSLMTALLVNLTGNAVKYGCRDGHVWVSALQKGETLELRVRDDGIGIGADDLPHVFERFYRADKARDRSGSGLGLAIAKWIVELHGGKIWAESTQARGSCFVVEMRRNGEQ